MTIAAQAAPLVDVFAGAREELEVLFGELTDAGACSHVKLGALITEGLARVARLTFQGHLDALFEQECIEAKLWPRPEGKINATPRHATLRSCAKAGRSSA